MECPMLRQPRLNVASLLRQVIARGIDRREVFAGDRDRQVFIDRPGELVPAAGARVFAWSYIAQLATLSTRNPATVSRAIELAHEEAAEEAITSAPLPVPSSPAKWSLPWLVP